MEEKFNIKNIKILNFNQSKENLFLFTFSLLDIEILLLQKPSF